LRDASASRVGTQRGLSSFGPRRGRFGWSRSGWAPAAPCGGPGVISGFWAGVGPERTAPIGKPIRTPRAAPTCRFFNPATGAGHETATALLNRAPRNAQRKPPYLPPWVGASAGPSARAAYANAKPCATPAPRPISPPAAGDRPFRLGKPRLQSGRRLIHITCKPGLRSTVRTPLKPATT